MFLNTVSSPLTVVYWPAAVNLASPSMVNCQWACDRQLLIINYQWLSSMLLLHYIECNFYNNSYYHKY